MRRVYNSALAFAAVMLVPTVTLAQGMGDSVRVVAGGGVLVAGWRGTVDPTEASRGQVLNNAKLASQGAGLRVTTGPAMTYWNPANRATGDYTVKATFTEEKYMSLNDHPHPYGIVIAGNDMGTDNAELPVLRRIRQWRASSSAALVRRRSR